MPSILFFSLREAHTNINKYIQLKIFLMLKLHIPATWEYQEEFFFEGMKSGI